MQNVYSVGQVNAYIKSMFTQDYVLRRIYVKGEISNCKYHTSGHIYFSLKDESGTIACVMFASARKGLAFSMKNGQQVIVLGTVNVYERDGRYQLYASEIILDGAGLLYEKFEALKRELEEMGMFAPEYKQPIPRFIHRLGVVTAPTGAAIRDIIQVSKRRNPGIEIILYPALVQGEGAAESVAKGIRMLDDYGVDLMIVGRGGGSIEDLWAFNEEITARAIFNCRTPVISAVGHETDTTIADYVADLRAPTPSAAAELAVADLRSVQADVCRQSQQLQEAMLRKLWDVREKAAGRERILRMLGPDGQIREKRMRLLDAQERMSRCMEEKLQACRQETQQRAHRLGQGMEERHRDLCHRMKLYIEKMKGLSPLNRLDQGYSYTSDLQGKKVTQISQVKAGDLLQIFVSDGRILAEVKQTERHETKP
ncbi:MAG: exodeoxyribonuclease VII large subunit [Lachnospiraceae bacterium]|nr:exodeoxyribonuclease VII large subunit [Lachnospiraceae bacterium]